MATNIQVNTTEGTCAIIYFQDGSTLMVNENSNESIQLVDKGFCTISEQDVAEGDEEANEHPPAGYAFVEMMVKFWQTLAAKIKQEAPTATPYESKETASTQRRDYKKKEGDDGYGDEPPQ